MFRASFTESSGSNTYLNPYWLLVEEVVDYETYIRALLLHYIYNY